MNSFFSSSVFTSNQIEILIKKNWNFGFYVSSEKQTQRDEKGWMCEKKCHDFCPSKLRHEYQMLNMIAKRITFFVHISIAVCLQLKFVRVGVK